jgi:hypothetical protein
MWERDPSLPERVAEAWAEAGPKATLADINMSLVRVMTQLQKWSKQKFGSVNRELEKLKKLEELMHMNADRMEIRAVTDRMNEMLYREEMHMQCLNINHTI